MQAQCTVEPSASINSSVSEAALSKMFAKQFNRQKDEIIRITPRAAQESTVSTMKVEMVAWSRDMNVLFCALQGGVVSVCNLVNGSKMLLFQPKEAKEQKGKQDPQKKADDGAAGSTNEGWENPFEEDSNLIAAAAIDAIKPNVLLVSIVGRKLVSYMLDPSKPSSFDSLLTTTGGNCTGTQTISDLGVPIGECCAKFSSTGQFLLLHIQSRSGARWGVVQRRGASSLSLLHSWQTEGAKRITDVCWARNSILAFCTDRGEVFLVDVVSMSQLCKASVTILPPSRIVAFPISANEVIVTVSAENLLQSFVCETSVKRKRDAANDAVGDPENASVLPLASWSAAEYLIQDINLVVAGGKDGGSQVLYVLLNNGVLTMLHASSLQRLHGEEIKVVSTHPMLAVKDGLVNTVGIVDGEHLVVLGR